MPRGRNWADVLDRDSAFVVLTKQNRLQVIVRPSRKQLRRRGKRGWEVAAAIDAVGGSGPAPAALREAIAEVLEVLHGGREGKKKARRKKKRPAPQAE